MTGLATYGVKLSLNAQPSALDALFGKVNKMKLQYIYEPAVASC